MDLIVERTGVIALCQAWYGSAGVSRVVTYPRQTSDLNTDKIMSANPSQLVTPTHLLNTPVLA